MTTLTHYLVLSSILFCVGLAGALVRRNAILVLIGVELMLNAANLNFIGFWRFHGDSAHVSGPVMVLFSLAVAAAEAAVGLALIILIHRRLKTTRLDEVKNLKG